MTLCRLALSCQQDILWLTNMQGEVPGVYLFHHMGIRPAGLEPATPDLEGRCSIQLSYGRKSVPDWIRTSGPEFRKFVLYPTELRRLENRWTVQGSNL